jgi:hypothetical protein
MFARALALVLAGAALYVGVRLVRGAPEKTASRLFGPTMFYCGCFIFAFGAVAFGILGITSSAASLLRAGPAFAIAVACSGEWHDAPDTKVCSEIYDLTDGALVLRKGWFA